MIHWLCPQMLLVLLPEISGEERGYRHPQSTFPSLRSFLLCIALSVLGVYLAFQTLRPASILLCATSVTAETFIEAILHRPTGPSASSSLFAFQEIKFPSIAILGFTSSSHAVSFLRIMPSLQPHRTGVVRRVEPRPVSPRLVLYRPDCPTVLVLKHVFRRCRPHQGLLHDHEHGARCRLRLPRSGGREASRGARAGGPDGA
jgi:hypothetical protein